MGSQYSCNYGDSIPDSQVGTAKAKKKKKRSKNKSIASTENESFQEGTKLQTTRKIRVRINKGQITVELRKGLQLRITKVINGEDGKPKKLEVESEELDRTVILKKRVFQFLTILEGGPNNSISGTKDDENSVNKLTLESRQLSKIGWYEVQMELPTDMEDDRLSKGHVIRIIDVRRKRVLGAEGKLNGSGNWVTVYDDQNVYMTYIDEERIMGYDMESNSVEEAAWLMALNYPAGHTSNQWEVTRIDPQGQGARRGIQVGWTIVGVNDMTTALNPQDCERLLSFGEECTIYFDTLIDCENQNPGGSLYLESSLNDSVHLSDPSIILSVREGGAQAAASPVQIKVKEIKPRRASTWVHWVCGFAGCALLGLFVTVLVLLEIYSISHFDRHDKCSEFPILLFIWSILIILIFLGAIPAGCDGELQSSCFIGCTEWYARGTWVSVLFSIFALVQFFTLSDSCKDEIKENAETWFAYQLFVWTHVGMGGLAIFFTIMNWLKTLSNREAILEAGVELINITLAEELITLAEELT